MCFLLSMWRSKVVRHGSTALPILGMWTSIPIIAIPLILRRWPTVWQSNIWPLKRDFSVFFSLSEVSAECQCGGLSCVGFSKLMFTFIKDSSDTAAPPQTWILTGIPPSDCKFVSQLRLARNSWSFPGIWRRGFYRKGNIEPGWRVITDNGTI